MSQAKTNSLKAAKHWAKLRAAVRVSGAFKIAGLSEEARETLNQRLIEVEAAERQESGGSSGRKSSEGEAPSGNVGILKERLIESPINTAMYIAVPLGILAAKASFPPWMVFWLNFFALIPLSGLLGSATEDIASYTSEVVAGLLNATFGNVVEMLVAVAALAHGDIIVVQSTLLGSILSNLLFVLGSCFIYGGTQMTELNFSSKAGSTCTSLLLLACSALVLPTALTKVLNMDDLVDAEHDIVLPVSRFTSIVIFAIYLQFLYFQLVSHKDYFADEEDDDDDEERWSMPFACVILGIASVVTAYTADFLVDSIHGYAADMNLCKSFIGLILVASVGNIPEFYVTLMVAKNNKLDLALTIAVGSSCQMALFVTPFAVLAGWAMDVPMTLDFHMLQIVCLLLAVLTVSSVIQSGSATYLHGSLLVGSYIIIAVMFFFLPPGAKL